IVGLALRRLDTQVQQQALLDGVLWRVTLRQLAAPIIASAAIAMILAVQEFSVYEPTGISVVATEVRMVFETGAFSSPNNPITAPMGTQGAQLIGSPDQASRAAAAVATSLPLLIVILVMAALSVRVMVKTSVSEHIETGAWPRSLDAGWIAKALALVVLGVAVVLPIVSLVVSHQV